MTEEQAIEKIAELFYDLANTYLLFWTDWRMAGDKTKDERRQQARQFFSILEDAGYRIPVVPENVRGEAEKLKQAGIREVVDFILHYAEYHAHTNLVDFVGAPLDMWEAKLKEWGYSKQKD